MIIESIIIGIIGWTFVHILIDVDMIFSRWWIVLNKLPDWLAKPLGKCEYCLSGQIALWYFIINYGFNLAYLVAFVSVSIFTCKLINKIIHGT
jgi:hypothetical protein